MGPCTRNAIDNTGAIAGTLFNDYLTPQLDARLSLTEQLPDLNTNPSIAYAILYEAICLHQLGDYADRLSYTKCLLKGIKVHHWEPKRKNH